MKRVPQGRYTREFRQEAVKLVMEEKLSMPEAGRRLSLPPSMLGYWVKVYKAGKLGDVGKSYRPLTEVEIDLARTKKELAEVKVANPSPSNLWQRRLASACGFCLWIAS